MRTRRPILAVLTMILLVATLSAAFAQKTETTLTGCLAKADDGSFTLTEKGKTEKVKLHTASDLGLAAHAGHTVKLTGAWQGEGAEKVFHVTKMEHVSPSCS